MSMKRPLLACLLAALTLNALPRGATAQPAGGGKPAPAPAPTPGEPEAPPTAPTEADLAKARPWAKDVSPENQKAALELFAEGNKLLRNAVFVKAAETYRKALEFWAHPAIHYNLALALVNLDRPVEMFQSLEKALEYGPAPLDQDKFDRATGFKILVERQLGYVDLTCDTKGAVVFLDGQEVFTAPGSYKAMIRIGEHTVTAKKSGYVSATVGQKLGPQETFRLNLKLYTDEELTRYKRRFPTWLPWTTIGVGAAVVGLGVAMHVGAASSMDEYNAGIEACGGCVPPTELADKKSSAETKQTIAFTSYVLGGAALATGVVLLLMNSPESYRINGLEKNPDEVAVTPIVGKDLVGASARWKF